MSKTTDVLVVGNEGTIGWRGASQGLSDALRAAGAQVRTVGTGATPEVRTFMLTDLVQARAARAAATGAIAEHDPGAIIYCSITAALLWPRPGAIWLDSIAAENRPGRHGIWQRVVERRRLMQAPLILAMAETSLDALNGRAHADSVVVPVAIEASGPSVGPRNVDVLAYTGNPVKRRLDFILAAWQRARRGDETLVVAGIERPDDPAAGVRYVGRLAPDEYRALQRRARVYVAAPVREDFGIAPLEALADGCMLVSTPAPGAYPALDLARELDPRLVGEDLVPALRAALDEPSPGYGARARALLEPFSPESVDRTLAADVLPRLLPAWRA